MRRRIITILALALSLLMVAGLASAQESDAGIDGVVLHGKGKLVAAGHGTAVLDMGGTLYLRIRGNVAITDLAGNARIAIDDGPESDVADRAVDGGTTVVLQNFSGTVKVRGRHFRVRAEGTMFFVAKGQGRAFLHGRGWWRTRTNRGTWSGVHLDFES